MKPGPKILIPCILALTLLACSLFSPVVVTPTSLPSVPTSAAPSTIPSATPPPAADPTTTDTPTIQPPPPTVATFTPEPSPTDMAPLVPEEAIYIQQPASGSHVTSPIRVLGEANPTFEQNLVVRIVSLEGDELALAPTTIQADVGQRGRFEVELPLDLDEEANVFIQVYADSPRDGGITHLASSGVIFTPQGTTDIRVRQPQEEQIAIFQPGNNATLSGGVAHVEGFALASFEGTLLIEILDVDGNVIGAQPVIVQAPDMGQPGPYSADVPYSLANPGPGRVVVRDVSPAFGGDSHRSSVEVKLEP